jgi:hypothetical protein
MLAVLALRLARMSVVGGVSAGSASALSARARSLGGGRRFQEIAHPIRCRACLLCGAVESRRERDHIPGKGCLTAMAAAGVCAFSRLRGRARLWCRGKGDRSRRSFRARLFCYGGASEAPEVHFSRLSGSISNVAPASARGMQGADWIAILELLHVHAGIAFVCTSCRRKFSHGL